MNPLHMVRVQGPPSLNPRYYDYVHRGVLCNEQYAPNLVVDDDLHVLRTIFMYYGLFSCIMDEFLVLWMI
jgi:hypothetical protein